MGLCPDVSAYVLNEFVRTSTVTDHPAVVELMLFQFLAHHPCQEETLTFLAHLLKETDKLEETVIVQDDLYYQTVYYVRPRGVSLKNQSGSALAALKRHQKKDGPFYLRIETDAAWAKPQESQWQSLGTGAGAFVDCLFDLCSSQPQSEQAEWHALIGRYVAACLKKAPTTGAASNVHHLPAETRAASAGK